MNGKENVMSTTHTQTTLNGVDVTALLETLGAMKKDGSLGSFRFQATNRWSTSSHNRTEMACFSGAGEDREHPAPFTADNDEPVVLGGTDKAPNPVEWLLHALAGCVTTTVVFHAASRGIRIDSIESTLEGDIDVRGFTGVSKGVPKGYQEIRVTMKIASDAPAAQLKELAEMSPVYNTLTLPTPVKVTIEKV